MTTTTQIISNILGGVSQQPEPHRLPNQAREAINTYFSPTEGTGKRWPTQHLLTTYGTATSDRFTFGMDRDDEDYVIMVGSGVIGAWDSQGNVISILDSTNSGSSFAVRAAALAYIDDGAGPGGTGLSGRDDFRSQVVVDTAFLVNRNVIITESEGPIKAGWDVAKRSAGVFVRQMGWNVGLTITMKVAGKAEFTVSYKTPSNILGMCSNIALNGTGGGGGANDGGAKTTTTISTYHAVENGFFLNEVFGDAPPTDIGGRLFARTGAAQPPNTSEGFGKWTYDPVTGLAQHIADTVTTNQYFGWMVDESRGGYAILDTINTGLNVHRISRAYPISTEYACRQLRRAIQTLGSAATGVTAIDPAPGSNTYAGAPGSEDTEGGSSFLLTTVADIEKFEVTDTVGDTYITGWTETAEDITDLPLSFRHGALARIEGNSSTNVDDYFLRFATDTWALETDRDFAQFVDFEADFGPGQWIEAAKPLTGEGRLDSATMPHVIIRSAATAAIAAATSLTEGDIYFDFRPWQTAAQLAESPPSSEWADRTVGNDVSSPAPSFVGATINDIFFWQGRLGFLSESNVILSEVGELDNFWRTTQLSVPDSDIIDVASTEDQGATLNHAIPLDERLLMFTKNSQVVLASGASVLSPATVEAPVVSSFVALDKAPPVKVGRSVFFPYANTNFVGVRELLPLQDIRSLGDIDITSAVPRYIPVGGSHRIRGSSSDNIVLMHTDAEPKKLYVFKYVKGQNQSYQLANWCTWQMAGTVVDFLFIGEKLYLMMSYDTGTALETMEIGPGQSDANSEYVINLDRKLFYTGSASTTPGVTSAAYVGATDLTTFTFSVAYIPDTTSDIQAVTANDGAGQDEGYMLDVVSYTPATRVLIVRGDYASAELWFGEPYTFSWTANATYMKQQSSGSGVTPMRGRRTVIQGTRVSYSRTGFFEVQVEYKAGDTFTTPFNDGGMGTLGVGLELDFDNFEPLRSGTMTVPVHAVNNSYILKLLNSGPLPTFITGLEWDITQNPKHGVQAIL